MVEKLTEYIERAVQLEELAARERSA